MRLCSHCIDNVVGDFADVTREPRSIEGVIMDGRFHAYTAFIYNFIYIKCI